VAPTLLARADEVIEELLVGRSWQWAHCNGKPGIRTALSGPST